MRAIRITQMLMLTGVLLVTACASETPDKKQSVEVTQDVQADALQPWTPPQQPVEGVDPFKRTEPLPQTPPLSDTAPAPGNASYADMALAQTNGSVRIFSLDDPAPQAQLAASAPSMAPLHPLDNGGMTGSIEKNISRSLRRGQRRHARAGTPAAAKCAVTDRFQCHGVFLDEAAPRPRQQPQPVSPYPSGWMPGNELPAAPHESFGWASNREPVAKKSTSAMGLPIDSTHAESG